MALIGQQMATCVTHTPHDHVTYHYWYYGRRRPEQGFPASNRARSLIGMVTLFEPTQGPNMHGDRTCVQGCKEYGGHHLPMQDYRVHRTDHTAEDGGLIGKGVVTSYTYGSCCHTSVGTVIRSVSQREICAETPILYKHFGGRRQLSGSDVEMPSIRRSWILRRLFGCSTSKVLECPTY